MKNKVLVIGADHHNTLGIVESLVQKGLNSYVLIVGENINSFVLKSRYVIEGWVCSSPEQVVDEMLKHFSDTKNTVCNVLENLIKKYPENSFTIALTGSGAMSASKFKAISRASAYSFR